MHSAEEAILVHGGFEGVVTERDGAHDTERYAELIEGLDDDGDGIPDFRDECSNTMPGAGVSPDGCPRCGQGSGNDDGDEDGGNGDDDNDDQD